MIADKVKELEQENSRLKVQVDELQEICSSRGNLPKNCEHCRNYMQHYIKCGTVYVATYDGHCVAGNRIKHKKINETCKSFMKKPYGRNCV